MSTAPEAVELSPGLELVEKYIEHGRDFSFRALISLFARRRSVAGSYIDYNLRVRETAQLPDVELDE